MFSTIDYRPATVYMLEPGTPSMIRKKLMTREWVGVVLFDNIQEPAHVVRPSYCISPFSYLIHLSGHGPYFDRSFREQCRDL